MKIYSKIVPVIAALGVVSCTDYDLPEFSVPKPETSLEYLNDYDALKTYVNRTENPDFKLGAGVNLSEYVSKGVPYRLVTNNFDEITAGYEMKHMAVVQSDGTLALNNVEAFIETAAAAGITIYGHTLCWHANQNAAYLNSLIAPTVIEPEPGETVTVEYIKNGDFEEGNSSGWNGWGNGSVIGLSSAGEGYGDTGYALKITNPSEVQSWEVQVSYGPDIEMPSNELYTLSFRVKGTVSGTIEPVLQRMVAGDYGSNSFGAVNVETDWTRFENTITATEYDLSALLFSVGGYAGTVWIDDISLTRESNLTEDPYILDESVIKASDFEDQDMGTWSAWGAAGPTISISSAGEGYQGGYALVVTNTTPDMADWQGQFGYKAENNFEKGEIYQLNMRVKGTIAGSLPTAVQLMQDPYPSDGFSGRIEVTTDWTEVELTVNVTDDNRDNFLVSVGHYVGTLWFDDITLCKRINTNLVEKTPEEKTEIIGQALEDFISGMLEVTSGYVKAWDVVNEPMSDWPDPYQLKTGIGNNDLAADEFYWQDYLGKDYAVMAFNLAVKYGTPDDVLFINDYGLESNLDKCKGLIQYVEYIESQGARVDGIGTQMHVNMDADRENIAEMFRLLTATGKKIKISELDMGVGNGKKTEDTTEEEHLAMADLYKYIVKTYFEIIPPGQRYGITHWSPTDSPESSSWRGGEPIGLWTIGYDRKHEYAGFADGLSGK